MSIDFQKLQLKIIWRYPVNFNVLNPLLAQGIIFIVNVHGRETLETLEESWLQPKPAKLAMVFSNFGLFFTHRSLQCSQLARFWINFFVKENYRLLQRQNLALSVVRENGEEELVSRSGTTRFNEWEEITLAFHMNPGETFQIKFGFTCGGYKGDLALDDID